MEQNIDFKYIKKHYGEKFAQLCRDLFPTILERPGILSEIISKLFAPNRCLYDDIIQQNMVSSFKNYVYKSANVKNDYLINIDKTPAELLKEAGYTLYECKSEKDIQKFRKYYVKDEEICTFWTNRLNRCYVFFAVKDNVKDIKRSDFKEPDRQDEYGTSVISIQFTKDEFNTLSIKNRYNHKVDNPDATFSNNLENIIPGLTESFNRYYHFKTKSTVCDFELSKYVKASDGRLYKYNYEIDNIYYCPNNIVIDNFKAGQLDKEKYDLIDYFVLDKRKGSKSIKPYSSIKDSFPTSVGVIEKIEEINNLDDTKKIVINDNVEIVVDSLNRIISYKNVNIEKIGSYFLEHNRVLANIEIPNVKKIDYGFLDHNLEIENLDLPSVEEISDNFLNQNEKLTSISIPNLRSVDYGFLFENRNLKKLFAPSLEIVGSCFLYYNKDLESLYAPTLKKIGDNFLYHNNSLTVLDLESVIEIDNLFLFSNKIINSVCLPNVKTIHDDFLSFNNKLEEIYLPSVEKIGDCFLELNQTLENISMPKVKNIGTDFLTCNSRIKKANGVRITSINRKKLRNLMIESAPQIEKSKK